jgi:chitin disaccharide deacetylase
MLVINADDFGRNRLTTDRILVCHVEQRITSTSAMVFMEDSERAAILAKDWQVDVGLHINFTESFTGPSVSQRLRRDHERIRRFLRLNKYALLIYNPFLRNVFRAVFEAQLEEFARLYDRPALRFDGHQHMHLCSNMIVDRVLPAGAKVRRSFSFRSGEKSFLNRFYRAAIDRRLATEHSITDFFFALSQHLPVSRLQPVIEAAKTSDIELMTHPEVNLEFETLMSAGFADAILQVRMDTCARL